MRNQRVSPSPFSSGTLHGPVSGLAASKLPVPVVVRDEEADEVELIDLTVRSPGNADSKTRSAPRSPPVPRTEVFSLQEDVAGDRERAGGRKNSLQLRRGEAPRQAVQGEKAREEREEEKQELLPHRSAEGIFAGEPESHPEPEEDGEERGRQGPLLDLAIARRRGEHRDERRDAQAEDESCSPRRTRESDGREQVEEAREIARQEGGRGLAARHVIELGR
jgi:hypothetical protein